MNRRRAKLLDLAMRAVRISRRAAPPAMPDQPVAEKRLLRLRQALLQRDSNLLRRLFARQIEPPRQAGDVRIDPHAMMDAERVSQNDLRRLTPHAIRLDELIPRARHVAAVVLDEFAVARLDVFRLVAENSDAPDVVGERRGIGGGAIRGAAIFSEKVCCRDVDLLGRALCGENCGDEQIESANLFLDTSH